MGKRLIVSLLFIVEIFGCAPFGDDDDSDDDSAINPSFDEEGFISCEREIPEPLDEPDLSVPTVVSWRDDLTITVNDVPIFPIGAYRVPLDEEIMRQMQEAGMNAGVVSSSIEYLEMGKNYGMLFGMHPPFSASAIYMNPPEVLKAMLDERAQYGSLFFWYTFDEPDLWNVDHQLAEDLNDFLHEYEPNHPTALVEAPMMEFGDYVNFCDIFMVDPYPVPMMPIEYTSHVIEKAKEFTSNEKPLIGVAQAFDWRYDFGEVPDTEDFRPTVQEIRNMTYQMIALDVQGIIYFEIGRLIENHPPIWEGLLDIVREVDMLRPVIIEGEDLPLSNVPDLIRARLVRYKDWLFLFVINVGWKPIKIELKLPDDIEVSPCAVEFFEGYNLGVASKKLVDTIPSLEVRVYQMFVKN